MRYQPNTPCAQNRVLKWLGALLFMIGALSFAAPLVADPGAGKDSGVEIRLERGFLTVRAGDVPHKEILAALAQQLRFELILAKGLEEKRSLDIRAEPWEDGLKKAIAPADWAFIYRDSDQGSRLAKVIILPSREGEGAAAQGFAASEPGETGKKKEGGQRPEETQLADAPVSTGELGITKEERLKAIEALTEREPEIAVPALVRELNDPDPAIRAAVAEALGESYDISAVQPLGHLLLNDVDPDVREAAAEMLGEIGHPQALFMLREALNDPDGDIRERVVQAIGDIGGTVAEELLRYALQDEDKGVAETAAEVLVKVKLIQ